LEAANIYNEKGERQKIRAIATSIGIKVLLTPSEVAYFLSPFWFGAFHPIDEEKSFL
jgi:hypothetical protein